MPVGAFDEEGRLKKHALLGTSFSADPKRSKKRDEYGELYKEAVPIAGLGREAMVEKLSDRFEKFAEPQTSRLEQLAAEKAGWEAKASALPDSDQEARNTAYADWEERGGKQAWAYRDMGAYGMPEDFLKGVEDDWGTMSAIDRNAWAREREDMFAGTGLGALYGHDQFREIGFTPGIGAYGGGGGGPAVGGASPALAHEGGPYGPDSPFWTTDEEGNRTWDADAYSAYLTSGSQEERRTAADRPDEYYENDPSLGYVENFRRKYQDQGLYKNLSSYEKRQFKEDQEQIKADISEGRYGSFKPLDASTMRGPQRLEGSDELQWTQGTDEGFWTGDQFNPKSDQHQALLAQYARERFEKEYGGGAQEEYEKGIQAEIDKINEAYIPLQEEEEDRNQRMRDRMDLYNMFLGG